MKKPQRNMESLARAYWQPLLIAVLALLILFQTYAWAVKIVDLHKVDSLLSQAEQINSAKKNNNNAPTSQGMPASSPGMSNPGGPTGAVIPAGGPPDMGMGMQRSGNPGMGGMPAGMPMGMSGGMPAGMPGPDGAGEQKKPKKNIFKAEMMNYQLTAIYMDRAVINGQDVKVGDRVGKALLKEIGVFDVKIQEEGKENPQTIQMFTGQGGSPMMGGPMPQGGMPPGMNPGQPRGPRVTTLQGGGIQPPPQAQNNNRGGFRERMQNMSPEERDRLRQRMQNMSPQEREQARERFMRGN